MKKLTILTSVLALAACGGGSGGGGVSVEPVKTTAVSFSVNQARADNTKINYVLSKIPTAIDANATQQQKLAAAETALTNMRTTIQTLMDMGVNSPDLDTYVTDHQPDVNNALALFFHDYEPEQGIAYYINQMTPDLLESFDKSHGFVAGQMTPNDMVFYDDYGEVFTFNFVDGRLVSSTDSDGETVTFSNDGKYSYSWSDPLNIYGATSGDVDGQISLLGNQIGLKYSDFGYDLYSASEYWSGVDIPINSVGASGFIGGYIAKEVQKPDNGAVFTGVAAAPVIAHTYSEAEGDNFYSRVSKIDGATLEMKNNQEILTANFSQAANPWYDVVITKSAPGIAGTVIDLNGDGSNIPDLYKIKSGMESVSHAFDAIYYGDNGDASEVVAGAGVYGTGIKSDTEYTHEVYSDIVFGGKR